MTADVIVIGLGAMGSATLYQLARRGVRVLGIDRFRPPHGEGSSHGDTRITRRGVGEGAVYGPLAVRSHAIWRDLEAATGLELLRECGFLAIDGSGGAGVMHGKPDFMATTLASAAAQGLAHEELGIAEARSRFPQFALRGHERVYFEPEGGLVFPERCITAQLDQAARLGARIRTGEAVVAIVRDGDGVAVTTDQGRYRADRVVLAAGGWTPGLAPRALGGLQLLRQVLHWYPPEDPGLWHVDRCPTFMWMHGATPADSFYGFPLVPGLPTAAVKVAQEQYARIAPAPDAIDRAVAADEADAMTRTHIAGRLNGLGGTSVRDLVCLYTFSPDGDFIIDHDPHNDRLLLLSACSGHGFKHSAAIGDHVAGVLADGAPLLPAFRLGRPGVADTLPPRPARAVES
ncbi:MAG: N-methyl-L-tryptophan oxidase [Alphaproteobacteria bacterium]|nr:MAG: N-methyl-L-tryptophan oxidase [Alphaproteobacteria bacterium]